MKIKSKLAQSTRSLVSQPVVKDLYGVALTTAGLVLAVAADVCEHYEKVLDEEYMRTYNAKVSEL